MKRVEQLDKILFENKEIHLVHEIHIYKKLFDVSIVKVH